MIDPNTNLSLKDMEGEEWRAVVGYEGLYEVSNMGRVKSLDRQVPDKTYGTKNLRGRILRQQLSTNKYKTITLSRECRLYVKTVHRLIALAFLPVNLPEAMQVNHKNLNKLDNRLENLEWCTNLENRVHATKAGRHSAISNPNCSQRYAEEAVAKVKNLLKNTTLTQKQIEKETGVAEDMVGAILRGEVWQIPGERVKITRPKIIRRRSSVPISIEEIIKSKILTSSTKELVKEYKVTAGYVYRTRAVVRGAQQ